MAIRRLAWLLSLALLCSCRFHSPLELPVKSPDPELSGLWQPMSSAQGSERLLIRSVGDGRYRLLVQDGASRQVLDVHLSDLGAHQVAQARLMASVGSDGQAQPPAEPTWVFLTVRRDAEQLTLRYLKPLPGIGPETSARALTRAVEAALSDGQALGEVVRYKRTETAKTKRL